MKEDTEEYIQHDFFYIKFSIHHSNISRKSLNKMVKDNNGSKTIFLKIFYII